MHHLVASYLAYKPPARRPDHVEEVQDVGELLGELGSVAIQKYVPIDTSAWDRMMADKNGSSEHG